MAETAAHAAQEKLATNIAAIDVSDVLAITEVFVLASADNERQVGTKMTLSRAKRCAASLAATK